MPFKQLLCAYIVLAAGDTAVRKAAKIPYGTYVPFTEDTVNKSVKHIDLKIVKNAKEKGKRNFYVWWGAGCKLKSMPGPSFQTIHDDT